MVAFAEYFKQLQWRGKFLREMVPWRVVAAPGVVLCKHRHGLLRSYVVRGHDPLGVSDEELGARCIQANNALKKLDGEWTVHAEARRVRLRATPEPPSLYPSVDRLLALRQAALEAEPGTFETHYRLSLTWTPPLGRSGGGLRQFVQAADEHVAYLRGVLATVRPMETPEQLTYLHACANAAGHPIAALSPGTALDMALCESAWDSGRYPAWDATLGGQHVRLYSVLGYPATSWATMLVPLERLGIEYRWVTRWTAINKSLQDGMLYEKAHDFLGQERSLVQWGKHHLWHSENLQTDRLVNQAATVHAEELQEARLAVGRDRYGLVQFAGTLMTWGPDADTADVRGRLLVHTLQGLGFTVMHEGEPGQRVPLHTAAWLGMMPGNTLDNIRTTTQSSITVTHLMPGLRASWLGPSHDAHLQRPAWFWAHTDQTSRVQIVNHVRDIGHFLACGPTGSGKTTMLWFLAYHWLKYATVEQPYQLGVLDIGKGGRLPTLLLGGEWWDVTQMQFPALREIDSDLDRIIALEWLLDFCTELPAAQQHIARMYVSGGLTRLRQFPPARRTLTALVTLLAEQSRPTDIKAKAGTIDGQGISHANVPLQQLVVVQNAVRNALQPFTAGGVYGGRFDGTTAAAGASWVQTYELEGLQQTPRLARPVIRYLFQAQRRRFSTDRPLLFILDEMAAVQGLPATTDATADFFMAARKLNVSLGVFIHNLAQLFHTPNGQLILDSCLSRYWFPNAAALGEDTIALYRRCDLTPEDIRLIATSQPNRDVYYCCREMGKRLLHVPLPQEALDLLARNTAADHGLMDRLLATEGREGFRASWQRYHHTAGPSVPLGILAAADEQRKGSYATQCRAHFSPGVFGGV